MLSQRVIASSTSWAPAFEAESEAGADAGLASVSTLSLAGKMGFGVAAEAADVRVVPLDMVLPRVRASFKAFLISSRDLLSSHNVYRHQTSRDHR